MPATDDVQAAFAAVSAILREGRLADLPAAAIALETALAAGGEWSPAEAEGLRDQARRLKRQLEAAARGIRSAQARLADIRAARQSATYDGAGRRSGLSSAATVARRF